MMNRYHIKQFFAGLKDPDVDELCLPPAENRAAISLLHGLKELEEVTKKLQCKNTTIILSRDLQDETIDDFSELSAKLSSNLLLFIALILRELFFILK